MAVRPPPAKSRAGTRSGGAGVRNIPSPRYHQVYVTLRTWVRDGTYRAGDQIPTEPELCRMFDVSRITVRKAIEDLAREGWLLRQQGKGTFVQLSSARPAALLDLNEARSQVADLAAATDVRDLVVNDVEPDEETRAALDLPVGDSVQRASHVRVLRGDRELAGIGWEDLQPHRAGIADHLYQSGQPTFAGALATLQNQDYVLAGRRLRVG